VDIFDKWQKIGVFFAIDEFIHPWDRRRINVAEKK
jgi:hypothetical protein